MTTESKRTDFSRRVVCVAHKLKRICNFTGDESEIVICSVRHFDPLVCSMLDDLETSHNYTYDKTKIVQGFVDNFGQFLTREEAKEIVNQNGQAIAEHCDTQLFSEDLY